MYGLPQLKRSRIQRVIALTLAMLFIPAVGWAAPQASAYRRLASWLRKAHNNAVEFTQGGPYDVRTFGAVLDGITDDSAAIQRAVDQQGKIIFPPNSAA